MRRRVETSVLIKYERTQEAGFAGIGSMPSSTVIPRELRPHALPELPVNDGLVFSWIRIFLVGDLSYIDTVCQEFVETSSRMRSAPGPLA